MSFIARALIYLKLKWTYNPFFSKSNKRFFSLNEINKDPLPKNITKIYKEISKHIDIYQKEAKLYEDHFKLIDKHNDKVAKIKEEVKSFDYYQFINDPIRFNKEVLIDKYSKLFKTIDEYHDLDEQYVKFKKNYSDIFNNYEVLLGQYNYYLNFHNLLENKGQSFIDSVQKELMIKEFEKNKNEIRKNKKDYYNITKIDNLKAIIEENNNLFVQNNINDTIFDNVNGLSLDPDQREAILKDDISSLVVAGAGSGKTLTICGKVKYLLEKKNVNPKDILLLSYSKKSSLDLENKSHKINKDITVNTFHKLGLDILKTASNKTFVVEEQYNAIIEKYFSEELKNNDEAIKNILNYYSLFISNPTYDDAYESKGELYETLKRNEFTTLKDLLISFSPDGISNTTLKKEKVKSSEELAIANYYFLNGINYEYEKPYQYETATSSKRQYLPDFTLTDYGIYHEHFGVDEHDRAKQFSPADENEYIQTMLWKKELHKAHNTVMLETKSYQMRDGTLFKELENQLKAQGVEYHPLSNEQIYNAMESIYHSIHFKSLIKLISTFISLYKANYRDDKGFEELKKSNFPNSYHRNRTCLFLNIARDVYNYYMNHIRKEGKIDFDDMILQSKDLLANLKEFKFKYVIIDEFQDISMSRMNLLKELIKHGNSKLFAVGDDWQSIYRFAGSDIDIFTNFGNYFGPHSKTFIHTTHRNSQELNDVACKFIMKNSEQLKKEIKSDTRLINPVQILFHGNSKREAFLTVLKLISKEKSNAQILILGRNNRDLENILADDIYQDYSQSNEEFKKIICNEYRAMDLSFTTVHGAKGLESEYVILINAEDGIVGFPNQIEDDVVLNLLLSDKSHYKYAEERRLFYVALTRTKTFTYILCDARKPSLFVNEIKDDAYILDNGNAEDIKNAVYCPHCKTGHLILRKGADSYFWGCSNFPYCTYTISSKLNFDFDDRCPLCGDFLIKRNYYGHVKKYCHNRNCSYKNPENKKGYSKPKNKIRW